MCHSAKKSIQPYSIINRTLKPQVIHSKLLSSGNIYEWLVHETLNRLEFSLNSNVKTRLPVTWEIREVFFIVCHT